MAAPKTIIDLVETFKNNEHIYTNGDLFDEENTKTDFINPFFECLGWDVTNKNKRSPQFKDVVFEKSIKVGTKTKAPDYEFRVGGTPIFFVEAKKPSVNIEMDKNPAFQIRRYGWSAKLKLCILTDFEELAVYETTTKPDKKQSASIGRVKYYHYSEYVEKWDEIAAIFSKEAVLNGDFDNFADSNRDKKKRGTGEVDDEFLKEMEHWRDLLARNIAIRNKDLNEDSLNYAVQITIDRILFCRMAEDRGIEKYGTLLELTEKDNIYQHLMEIFRIADLKYNSGLFCLSADPDRHINRDMVTEHLTIDDGVFKEIFRGLYYPNSPYEFSVISPEILGQVYEQLLGSIIRLTPSHMAKVEVKPEVKKAGGVYYTPQYIVKHIVSSTIGDLIKDKTPNQISKLKILDPACGSGSFLIVAYQELLNYHLDYYTGLEKPPKDTIYQGKDGEWRLTIREKKRILRNNIYGVDIDFLAVEVTKLSLLLKVLEDQNKDVVEQQQKLFHERVLPDLSNNIKNGNSLIGTDIRNEGISREELSKLNPFDWEEEFPLVFDEGGFDAVIGNPPYFNIQTLGNNSPYADYLKNNYEVYMDKSDILFYFIEKAVKMSKKHVEFIISNAFLFADKGVNLRNFIIDNAPISQIINFENFKVFKAGISTAIVQFEKNKNNNIAEALVLPDKDYEENFLLKEFKNHNEYIKVSFEKDNNFALIDDDRKRINNIIDKDSEELGNLFLVGKGMETAANDVYGFKEYPDQFPSYYIRKRISGSNIKKYHIRHDKNYLLYVEDVKKFNDLPDLIKGYLKENRQVLRNRATVKNEGRTWWRYSRPMHKELYPLPKIFCNYRNKTNEFALDKHNEFIGLTNTTVIFDTYDDLDISYLLCLLNSNVLTYRYQSIGKMTGGGSYEYFANGVSKLPIKVIDKESQHPFIDLANELELLNSELDNAKNPKEKKLLKQDIQFNESKVNQLVYELYGLNDDEIKIIEDNV